MELTNDTMLDGITIDVTAWTSHPTLVKDPNKKDKETQHPVGAIKQTLTIDYSGMTFLQLLKKAAATDRIKYQNGYARKAEPEKYLLNGDGGPRETFTIVVNDFFKGRESMSDSERVAKAVDKIDSIDELRNTQERLAARIKEIEKQGK